MKVKVTQLCLTLCDTMDYSPWNSPGQNTGVGSLSLLQGIFPTQGSNPGIEPRSPALQADSLPAEPQGPEKAMATHSSTLAWKIPWTEEPGGLQSMGSLRVRHD